MPLDLDVTKDNRSFDYFKVLDSFDFQFLLTATLSRLERFLIFLTILLGGMNTLTPQ
jgi:hypothetical protein